MPETYSTKAWTEIDSEETKKPWDYEIKSNDSGCAWCYMCCHFMCTHQYVVFFLLAGILCLVSIVSVFKEGIVPFGKEMALGVGACGLIGYFLLQFSQGSLLDNVNEVIDNVQNLNADMGQLISTYGKENASMIMDLKNLGRRSDEFAETQETFQEAVTAMGSTMDEAIGDISGFSDKLEETHAKLATNMKRLDSMDTMAEYLKLSTRYAMLVREMGMGEEHGGDNYSAREWTNFVQKIDLEHLFFLVEAMGPFIQKTKLRKFKSEFKKNKDLTPFKMRRLFPLLVTDENGEFSTDILCQKVVPAMSLRIAKLMAEKQKERNMAEKQ